LRAAAEFPTDKIEEAIKRLIERRYIVPASRNPADAVAGYWASLGFAGIAEKNFENVALPFRRSTCPAQPNLVLPE